VVREVETPDGERWRLRRRWFERRLPNPLRRFGKGKDRLSDSFGSVADGDTFLFVIAVAIVVLLVIPLLLGLLELLLFLPVILAAALGRVLWPRRRWTLEARPIEPPGEGRTWTVEGFRATGPALREAADRLRSGFGPPAA
jgi:hypothetical protein